MTTIVTRASNGGPLTNAQADQNLINLNAGKIETSLIAVALGLATLSASGTLSATQIPATINAATVTTNANMTGPIATIGNVTSITSQTGTGTTFAMAVSPTFTGVPISPTAAADTNSTQLATTAFVVGQASATNPVMNGAVTIGSSLKFARADHVHASDTSRAPTATPTFTGTATFSIVSATGQIVSTIATGTAPLVIASITQVANLNSSFLAGKTWAVPDPIGTTTPNSATFTNTTVTGDATIAGTTFIAGRGAVMTAIGSLSAALLISPDVTSSVPLIGTTQYAISTFIRGTSAATVATIANEGRVSSAPAAYTMPLGIVYSAIDGLQGAASSYTRQEGFRSADLTAAVTNVGFRSMLSAGANKWNAYFDGAAKNYFAGLTGFGVVTALYPVDVQSDTANGIGARIRARSSDSTGAISFCDFASTVEFARIKSTISGDVFFSGYAAADIQAGILNTVGATRYPTLTGSVAGAPILSSSAGGLAINVTTTNNITFNSVGGVNTQFRIRGDNVAINWLDVFGSTTGNAPRILAAGADANPGVNISGKGSGFVSLYSYSFAVPIFSAVSSSSTDDSYILALSGTGNALIQAQSSAANADLYVVAKGGGSVIITTGGGVALVTGLSVSHTASGVNYVNVKSGAAGANPTISSPGANLILGTGTALTTSATTGHLLFTSCAGKPTGTPVSSGTGKVPFIFDTTNNMLCVYNGAAWQGTPILGNLAGPVWASYNTLFDGGRAVINGYPITAEYGNNATGISQAFVGAIEIPAASAGGYHSSGLAGYARTGSTTQGAVGVYGHGGITANNASSWGANFSVTNAASLFAVTNTGFTNNVLYGVEVDCNIYKNGGVAPNVAVRGINVIGDSEVLSTSPVVNAIDIGLHGITAGIAWKNGFYTDDGATVLAFNIGTTGAGNSVGSQPIQLRSRTAAAVNVNSTIATNLTGHISFNPGTFETLRLVHVAAAVNRIQITSAATGNFVAITAEGETNVGLNIFSKGTGNIHLVTGGSGSLFVYTNGVSPQVSVTHTASADTYLVLTGAAAGNPSVNVSGNNLVLGGGVALATTAIAGHIMIPTCAGPPTGVPTGNGAGKLALIYDTTNNKLYSYNGAWRASGAFV